MATRGAEAEESWFVGHERAACVPAETGRPLRVSPAYRARAPEDPDMGPHRPHVVWPKKHSEEWRAEKIKEIEARVGRKANLGKLLTSQVRKERNERNDMEERMA
jgi:hypothetical protein